VLVNLTERIEMANTELKHIEVTLIHESEETLRGVDTSNEAFVGLVESVRQKGIMTPISVRELVDPDTDELIYGLVDGLQRYTAACEAGLDTIPCQVISISDGELMEAQIIANVHKIETKPVEYSKALLTILQNNPLMTRAELANNLQKTGAWISERLGLLKLTVGVAELVDDDKIGLSNAYALAKLPDDEQADFVERAMTMPPQQFAPAVNLRVKEIRDAARKGRDVKPEEFQPIPVLRTRKDLVSEMESPQYGPDLCQEVQPSSIDDAFALGVLWALNMDPRSVEVQRARDDERRAEKARIKEQSKIERKRKRAEGAAKKAQSLKDEAEAEAATVA